MLKSAWNKVLAAPPALRFTGAAALCLWIALMVLGWQIPTLDARLSYPPQEIGALFWQLGESGRSRYLLITRLDSAFLVAYSLFFFLLASHRGKGWRLWLSFGFIAATGLFDFAETNGIRYLLERFPAADEPVARIVAACTPLKWLSFLGTVASLVLVIRDARKAAGAPDPAQ